MFSLLSEHHGSVRVSVLVFSVFLALLCFSVLSAVHAAPQQQSIEKSNMNLGFPPDLRTPIPKTDGRSPSRARLRANFEQMKTDAGTLVELAKSLKSNLDKANPDQLPVQMLDKVEQINRLAKRIKKASSNF